MTFSISGVTAVEKRSSVYPHCSLFPCNHRKKGKRCQVWQQKRKFITPHPRTVSGNLFCTSHSTDFYVATSESFGTGATSQIWWH